jgi:hypothetical protein
VAATVDTLRLAKRFKDAGVPEAQAEVFAESFREAREAELAELATKHDIALVRADLREEILKIERRIDGLENRIEGLGQKLTIRLGLMIGAGVAILAAISRLP